MNLGLAFLHAAFIDFPQNGRIDCLEVLISSLLIVGIQRLILVFESLYNN